MNVEQLRFKKTIIIQAIGVIKNMDPNSTVQDIINELQEEVNWLDQVICEKTKGVENGEKENNPIN